MNHDITHCNGIAQHHHGQLAPVSSACPRRNTCHRYLAHLDAKQHHPDFPLSYIDAVGCIVSNYKLYYTSTL